ncbi:MAG: tRNA (adenosine(37)-N6)-threonylcarbamoyltransferase complex dimerization subunit type 1 TsaB [Gemmatimonadota bacterium]|nr:tRNA (adenosine(37)-N6)-threonylcarbamoyltransferase complex dimerization subunit type 1 TsaB [Gemmatimonadota bacterium]
MYVLGIETSTPVCSVGLVDEERVLTRYSQNTGLRHAERTIAMAERAIQDAGLAIADLHGIAVGSGPGSFTGLRIGMAAAKGLCFALNIPLLTVSTLKGLAARVVFERMPVCAILDARRGEVYAGVYRLDGGAMTALLPDAALPVEDLMPKLPKPVLFVGEGGWTYRSQIEACLGENAGFAPESSHPCGASVALLGVEALRDGNAVDLATAEPEYHRRSQAENGRRTN